MRNFVRREPSLDLDSKAIVIDLDDTLCAPDKRLNGVDKYIHARPYPFLIMKLRALHEEGWYITIMTSRHMVTCKGDVDEIWNRIGQITVDWLDKNNVPFDQLVFGKPWGRHYVDDKAMSIKEFMEME